LIALQTPCALQALYSFGGEGSPEKQFNKKSPAGGFKTLARLLNINR
jgi:hypothetical protein